MFFPKRAIKSPMDPCFSNYTPKELTSSPVCLYRAYLEVNIILPFWQVLSWSSIVYLIMWRLWHQHTNVFYFVMHIINLNIICASLILSNYR